MWANFISHCDEGAIFHNVRQHIISHRATARYFTFLPTARNRTDDIDFRFVEQAKKTPKEPIPRKKHLRFSKCFFQRNKSLSGFVKCASRVKYACGV